MFVYEQRLDKINSFTVELEGITYTCTGNFNVPIQQQNQND